MLLALAASTALVGAAVAEDFEFKLDPGETLTIPFYSYYRDCSSAGVQKLDIVEAPAHGKITTRYEDVVKDEGRCTGTKFRAHVLRYAPAKSFKGEDVFVIHHGYHRDDSFMKLTWRTYRLYVKVE